MIGEWEIRETEKDNRILVINTPNHDFFYCFSTDPQEVLDTVRKILGVPKGVSIVKAAAELANATERLRLAADKLAKNMGVR